MKPLLALAATTAAHAKPPRQLPMPRAHRSSTKACPRLARRRVPAGGGRQQAQATGARRGLGRAWQANRA